MVRIVLEKDTIWRMYGSDGRLLSGIPIHEIGTVKREAQANKAIAATVKAGKPLEIMPFGKYKGEKILTLPAHYRRWALENIQWHNGNMNLKQALL